MAVVAEGPSEERSSQQEVTLVPQASHRIVSMGMPRWVWIGPLYKGSVWSMSRIR